MLIKNSDLDFQKARARGLFNKIFNLFRNDDLLPLTEVSSLIKPQAQVYQGIRPVPLSLIIGSEGRYRDFSKGFFPRYSHLKSRWASINRAHERGLILPPVKLYEVGGIYFVRDGNHRVSVALQRGAEFIDAEVISLKTDIKLHQDMTLEELTKEVIEYEKRDFYKKTLLDVYRPEAKIEFTAPGRYDVAYNHILGHKYYLNLEKSEEIPLKEAVVSWYDKVYAPIVKIIEEERVLARFPSRTAADLYIWTVSYWDELKRRYGNDYSSKRAILKFTKNFGQNFWMVLKERLQRLFRFTKKN